MGQISDPILRAYQRHFLFYELLLSVIVIIITYFVIQHYYAIEQQIELINTFKEKIYPLIATATVTLLGFIITGVSILISFLELDKLKLLKESKHCSTLFQIYFSAIKYLAATTFLVILGIMLTTFSTILFYLTLWGAVISILRIWRCVWVLEQLISIING